MNHEYTVELRFKSDAATLFEEIQCLGLGCGTKHVFERQLAARIYIWGYRGEDRVGFKSEWAALEEGLEFLLCALDPIREKVNDLADRFEATWWCGHFQSSFDGGPTLSPKILKELVRYNIPVFIDNYFSSDTVSDM